LSHQYILFKDKIYLRLRNGHDGTQIPLCADYLALLRRYL